MPQHIGRHVPALRGSVVAMVALIVTITMQYWIGSVTIYRPELGPRRDALHEYILHNRLPPNTTWSNVGANGTNIRIVTVYGAEALHRALRLPLTKVYILIDSLALFLSLILVYRYARRWFGAMEALLGVLYVSAVLPLTFFLYYFHPWDRLSFLTWIIALFLLRDGRVAWLAVCLVVGVAVKFDIVVLPALYWLTYVSRRDWTLVTLKAGALCVAAFGTYVALRWWLPGGFEPRGLGRLVMSNVADIVSLNLRFPPLLAFALPIGAALLGVRIADRFARSSALFGLVLFVPFFLATNFAEFRAEMPILLLLLPAAMHGVSLVFEPLTSREDLARPAPFS